MTALSILALCVFIFGAYVYGATVVLSLRHRTPVWGLDPDAVSPPRGFNLQGLTMFLICTLWFVLHSVIEFRNLLGGPRKNDVIDLAAVELVFFFPALILHTVWRETEHAERTRSPLDGVWPALTWLLYGLGAAYAIYVPLAAYDLVAAPAHLSAFLGMSIGALFTICSVGCIALMTTRRRQTATADQRRMRTIMIGMFSSMIVVFVVLSGMRERAILIQVLDTVARALPLAFLIVSVYFESRAEFYDLVLKRGVLLLLTLLIGGALFGATLGVLDGLPAGPARPWLYAVIVLPIAMLTPWLHDRVGRLLDRLWFGREFTPVQAVKHVLGAMQQATDEVSLVAATEATLSEMFRKRIVIVLEDQPVPDTGAVAMDVRPPGTGTGASAKLVAINDPGSRVLLSEDLALLRSLGGVFGFMLENVRLHRKRQEQEQLAHDLRLQTSRSELKALRAQINPHFLFNALNAIASLIHSDPARADAAVEQLAEVFRYTLRRSDTEWAPLDQELAFARAYLDIEQARFGRRLTFAIDADPAALRAQVPSMLLQTLVENAVKHGISRQREPGHIAVRAHRDGTRLILEVRDTGAGLDSTAAARPSGESFGLRSVRDRLSGHFGAQATLELTRDDARGETIARITMPMRAELASASA